MDNAHTPAQPSKFQQNGLLFQLNGSQTYVMFQQNNFQQIKFQQTFNGFASWPLLSL
jgi:hypothetical protein